MSAPVRRRSSHPRTSWRHARATGTTGSRGYCRGGSTMTRCSSRGGSRRASCAPGCTMQCDAIVRYGIAVHRAAPESCAASVNCMVRCWCVTRCLTWQVHLVRHQLIDVAELLLGHLLHDERQPAAAAALCPELLGDAVPLCCAMRHAMRHAMRCDAPCDAPCHVLCNAPMHNAPRRTVRLCYALELRRDAIPPCRSG